MRIRPLVPLLAVLAASPAPAFHSGGVANCGGCHSAHAAEGGAGDGLLKIANPTDLCLSCHRTENGNTWGNDSLVPGPQFGGGSFVFLEAANLNDGPTGSDPASFIPGHAAGHSVLSLAEGILVDPEHPTAPGGTYPSDNLHCTSCHDPHGRGGHFRLLYGSDRPDARVNGTVFTYTRPAPDAIGIPLDGPPESVSNHTAYRSGMSEWCANCHGTYHDTGSGSAFEHPSGVPLDPTILDAYNRYMGTGDLSGSGLEAYVPQAPVEVDGSDTAFRGPVPTGARVTCVTCHRAHASSGPRSGRWDFEITTWAEEGIRSGTYPIPNPYAATAGNAQRQLCEKCHGSSP